MPSKRTKDSSSSKQLSTGSTSPGDGDFVVVAIGASAGGIEAVTELVRHLPADTGMGFVLIQHLDPKHQSMLTDLLGKQTTMSVFEVRHGMKIEANNVYVIPPNATMSIRDHVLQLQAREETRGIPMPIDHFMRSLAEANGNRSVGVVLSGSGTDGTLGMAEIQAQGGVTFAQDDESAKYNSMPHSAIAAGCVDYILPPRHMARELARIAKLTYSHAPSTVETALSPADTPAMATIFQLLRRSTGVDFTHYRQTTIRRRIQRRMLVHKLDRIEDYVRYLQSNTAEIKALYQDMLINVTSFFRNPSVFDALKSTVFPSIMKHRTQDKVLRVWTPASASGEETYSIAIAMLEYLGDKASQIPIQFFGTDVSEASVAKARAGTYPENIQGDVSTDRLRRFFIKVEGGFRISKSIRDMCIFAQHNLLSDPPFSQMDLICCRNLLIYLEPVLQNKAISLFHYATRPYGFLVLGTSEGLGSATSLFNTEDRAHKIFSKKTSTVRQVVTFSLNRQADRGEYGAVRTPMRPPESTSNYLEAQKEFDRRLVTQYAPATVFVNDEFEIVHTRGNVSRYLKLAPGRASLSILKMARESLLMELRNALARARKDDTTVRKQGIAIKNGNGNGNVDAKSQAAYLINLEVSPIRMGPMKELYFMIVFHEEKESKPALKPKLSRSAHKQTEVNDSRIAKLEQELGATKEYLQSVIETQEATNEELQSANEEILSSNEELQSTNEELETAKEELQSANEELSTVNDELRNRNADISTVNNDLTNLLASIKIAVIMVAPDVTIRRFTPEAQKTLGLIPADVGRPFININPLIQIPNLHEMILKVIGNGQMIETDAVSRNDHRYLLRIHPYRTSEGKTDGAVITLVDLSPREATESPAE